MRDKSLEAKQKRAAISQQTYIHAVRSSRSYVLACGAAHAASARRASPSAPRATPSIRPSNGAICALLPHPLVEWRHLRPTIPSACRTASSASCCPIRSSSGALCALLPHPLCEFAFDGGVLLLGNGKLAAVLQGHLAAGHVAHKSGVDQVACMAANKEVAVALGDRGERFD